MLYHQRSLTVCDKWEIWGFRGFEDASTAVWIVGTLDGKNLEEHTVSILRAEFGITTLVLLWPYNLENQLWHVTEMFLSEIIVYKFSLFLDHITFSAKTGFNFIQVLLEQGVSVLQLQWIVM
jgi:hypothetical protein